MKILKCFFEDPRMFMNHKFFMWRINLIQASRKIIPSQILIIQGGKTIKVMSPQATYPLGFGLQNQMAYGSQQANTQRKEYSLGEVKLRKTTIDTPKKQLIHSRERRKLLYRKSKQKLCRNCLTERVEKNYAETMQSP